MQQYIGTKIINAQPMNREMYNDFRGWTVPKDENPSDEGYLVEYTDGGKPNVEGYAGYVSWSPKEQFEKAYGTTDAMNFGLAVEAIKKGLKITRQGWNGAGQFVYYVPANSYPAQTDAAKQTFGDMVPYRAYMALKTVQNDIQVWIPSTTDVLADDWLVVE